ncbi:alcohol dehydrogenase catalytic domain-containing protein [Sinorhizobium meliloti]|jgi:2-desacetyl-2-hydroxyethyl bacteriochlorophyllide A dehydrogenase|uniref:alcohol dehydrogenase catalytic domain-containing protein n=1 Tax=Rhizobium meliloti TaxID=382 RepID=UPI000FD29196|nr:alcohol dehydrogenase catalytic domain-containing protein [Sinorhizobium meliloti]MQV24847.1 alcohol dehydrogenase catalytic domain-containing protein [Sinorhizobium meliloti]MQV37483.1 alcohol dehydrogenase catalytic domain-containing protein [Sinorhizobium meliloti]RVE79218.1 alcohol dehydrogenase [Sinorhizobium meliloti]RVG42708.1 alcohol dehydrogenase [Sinorhizobium meliloti]RVM08303.1 alcohol dehydrogenase [Sinorhizobium meliloti]
MSLDNLFGGAADGKMKAVRITQDHQISVVETTVPAVADDEVLVKPTCCGICGTDLHILKHGFVGTNYPVIPGHEFAGHVVAAGRKVRNLKAGDFVAVDPNVVCGECRWCQSGRPNLCIHLTPIGVGRAGAAAEYVAVPSRNAFKVSESIGSDVAALIEPLACALHAVDSSQGIKDRQALVLGGGTMGLLIAIAAKHAGAGKVTLADPASAKLDIARNVGVDAAVQPSDLGSERFDVVFEAAGVPAALKQGLQLVEKTGAYVQVGVHDEHAEASFVPFKLYEQEFRFIGSNSCADKFGAAVELMPDIRDKAKLLIGESFPVWSFDTAVQSMQAGKSIKTQLRFS